jgi:hypothetical protein
VNYNCGSGNGYLNGIIFVFTYSNLFIMKRFLSIVLVAAGLCYAGTLSAQTAPPPAPKSSTDSTQSSKKAEAEKSKPAGGSSDIMIDEGGTPKAKPKKRSGAKSSAKKAEGAAAEPAPSPEAPGLAIDEAGTSKPKPKPKANSGTVTPPNKSDSTIVAPASQVGRPE